MEERQKNYRHDLTLRVVTDSPNEQMDGAEVRRALQANLDQLSDADLVSAATSGRGRLLWEQANASSPAPPVEEVKKVKRLHGDYHLTLEQDHSVDLAETGEDLKIVAFAGAGKTSTLCAISKALVGKGMYLAFNKAIAAEAQASFPRNVEARTGHSLAFRAEGHKYANADRLVTRLNGNIMSKHLGIGTLIGSSPASTGMAVLETITNFCNSADRNLDARHLPNLRVGEEDAQQLASELVPLARKIWHRMMDLEDSMPVTHDVYLKRWALTNPVIDKDYILFDEAQDANPVILGVMEAQRCQKIFVGDSHQSIYGFRASVDSLKKIKTPNECTISQSFRFGPAIADLASGILNHYKQAGVEVRGFDKVPSEIARVESPDAILTRSNIGLIDHLFDARERGRKVSVVGGTAELRSLLENASRLRDGKPTTHPDLAYFPAWKDVVEYSESSSGADMRPLVKMMENYDVSELVSILESTASFTEDEADVVLSTAHKSKGREWKRVCLSGDFPDLDSEIEELEEQGEGLESIEEEVNLLYVAATRATHQLDISQCLSALSAHSSLSGKDEAETSKEDSAQGPVPRTLVSEPPEREVEASTAASTLQIRI